MGAAAAERYAVGVGYAFVRVVVIVLALRVTMIMIVLNGMRVCDMDRTLMLQFERDAFKCTAANVDQRN